MTFIYKTLIHLLKKKNKSVSSLAEYRKKLSSLSHPENRLHLKFISSLALCVSRVYNLSKYYFNP